jgi:1-acyl-sn-glycerol-3-phosphate acyltransferase
MSRLLDAGREILHALYGVYFAGVFLICAVITLILVLLLPGLGARRAAARGAARALFLLTGMGPELRHESRLPGRPCVVVANHASYLDGILLCAVLPPRFAFVIKSEMQGVPLAHFLLRRIGVQFVERFHHGRSARDARTILRRANVGESLAFFPEGTFHPEPGLRRFRGGAFAVAMKADAPVVPVVINGSRHALPSGRWLPRPGRLEVTILAAIEPAEHTAPELAALSRGRILDHLDEPDLQRDPGAMTAVTGRADG